MGDRDRPLFVGPSALASRVETELEEGLAVVESTAAAGEYLDEGTPPCVVTDHAPPTRDCVELLGATTRPVVVAPVDGGTSALATRALEAGAATYLDPTTRPDQGVYYNSWSYGSYWCYSSFNEQTWESTNVYG
ncbi:MAG: hypothetical protein R6V31_04325 [Halohasta sp.]